MSELNLVKEYSDLLKMEKEIAKRKEEIKLELIGINSEFIQYVDSERVSVDTKKLQAEQPAIFEQYKKVTQVTSIKVKV